MKRYLIYLFIMLCFINVQAQTVTVREINSNEAIAFAIAVDTISKVSSYSDEEGVLDLGLYNDKAVLQISILGYEDYVATKKQLSIAKTIYLHPSSMKLPPIVVSATRWDEERAQAMRVTELSKRAIAKLGGQTSADLLSRTGSVFMQKSQQGGGSPMIRGFAANRLLYSFDGLRMNTAIFRSGNLQNVINIDPLALQSSEIVYGPGSVLYGSDAIGGVMNFHTLAYQNKTQGRLLARYASANQEKTLHGDLAYKVGKLRMVTSMTYSDLGDLRMGSKGPKEYQMTVFPDRINGIDTAIVNDNPNIQRLSALKQYHFLQKVKLPTQRNNYWALSTYASTTTNYGRTDRLIRLRNNVPRSAEWNYGPQTWWSNVLVYRNQDANQYYDKANLQIGYQYFNESRKDRDFGKPIRNWRDEKVDALSLNIDMIKSLDKTIITYGVESVYNKVRSVGASINIEEGIIERALPRYPNSQWWSNAAFGTLESQLGKKTVLNVGLRYNYILLESIFDTTLIALPFRKEALKYSGIAGNIGIGYTLSPSMLISGQVSTGFRSPNVDDIGKVFDSSPGNVVVPNADLRPEQAINYELTWQHKALDILTYTVTGFYSRLYDGIIRRNYTFNGQDSIVYDGTLSQVQANVNASFINTYGVNASARMYLSKGWKMQMHYNWQVGQEELEDGLVSPNRHAAPGFGQMSVDKEWKRLNAELRFQFNQEVAHANMPAVELEKAYLYAKDEDGLPYSPSWHTIDAYITYKMLDASLNARVGVENILDQRYRPYSSGIVAGGRGVVVSLSWEF